MRVLHSLFVSTLIKPFSIDITQTHLSGGKSLRIDALIILGLYRIIGLALPLEHLANLLGYKNLTSKAFRALPTDLRKEGLLTYGFNGTGRGRTKIAALTPQGWQVARSLGVPSERPATNAANQDWIRRLLTTKNEITSFWRAMVALRAAFPDARSAA